MGKMVSSGRGPSRASGCCRSRSARWRRQSPCQPVAHVLGRGGRDRFAIAGRDPGPQERTAGVCRLHIDQHKGNGPKCRGDNAHNGVHHGREPSASGVDTRTVSAIINARTARVFTLCRLDVTVVECRDEKHCSTRLHEINEVSSPWRKRGLAGSLGVPSLPGLLAAGTSKYTPACTASQDRRRPGTGGLLLRSCPQRCHRRRHIRQRPSCGA